MTNQFTFRDAEDFYCMRGWADNYFSIDQSGQIVINFAHDKRHSLLDIVKASRIKYPQLHFPCIIRFPHILKDRSQQILQAFNQVREQLSYIPSYNLVYPVKVNQNKRVVDTLVQSSKSIGLECGSKAELLAILTILKHSNTPIVCNGYKDKDYIKLALLAQNNGYDITLVVEKLSEIFLIIQQAQEIAIKPLLAVRCRLQAMIKGQWSSSSGVNSKFGLNTFDLLQLIRLLKSADLLDSLQIIHCHQGSQIHDIKDIQQYVQELMQVYVQLYKLGCKITIVDIGGGLAVDYDGSEQGQQYSPNYSLYDYAYTVLNTIKQVCQHHSLPYPKVYSESGRALVAHHAVFITDVVAVNNNISGFHDYDQVLATELIDSLDDERFAELKDLLYSDNFGENEKCYYKGLKISCEINQQFAQGEITLMQKAATDILLERLKSKIKNNMQLDNLHTKLIANFSVFQAVPDSWAIKQVFPIMPLSHLDEEPSMEAVIEDITCDSDGAIKHYAVTQGNNSIHSLFLPFYRTESPYLLGFFLVGAYQETMGNFHNMFGRAQVLEVTFTTEGDFQLDLENDSNNIDVLQLFGYDEVHFKPSLINSSQSCRELEEYMNVVANSSTYYRA